MVVIWQSMLMATRVETIEQSGNIRVAAVIERGRIKPVWFEQTDKPSRDRVHIKEICYIWSHMEGAAKVINFAVWDGSNSYRLSLNTHDFSWSYGIAERTPI